MPDTKIVHEARSDNEVLAGDSWESENKTEFNSDGRRNESLGSSAVDLLSFVFTAIGLPLRSLERCSSEPIPVCESSGRPAKCGYQRGFWMHFWLLTSVNSGLKCRATLY